MALTPHLNHPADGGGDNDKIIQYDGSELVFTTAAGVLEAESLTDIGTPAADDLILVKDTSASGALKTAQASTIGSDGVPYVWYNPSVSDGGSWHHGMFWGSDVGTVNQGRFFWEAWVCPLGAGGGNAEYWISEGYGGAHAVLCSPVNGNIYDGAALTSWTCDYTPAVGEWVHVACSWDGTNVRHYTNGITTAVVAFAGPRRGGVSGHGMLFIGGSDHSNFNGKIAAVRGWETGDPAVSPIPYYYLSNGLMFPFAPDRSFVPFNTIAPTNPWAQFCADYTTPGMIIPDHGEGYPAGTLHPGGKIGTDPNSLRIAEVSGYFVRDPTCPLRGDTAVIPTRTTPTPPSTPASAKIFDSFSRASTIVCWQRTASLGSTEAGSLGALAWSDAGTFGIFDGRAVEQGAGGYSMSLVTNDSADMDVRVDRRVVSGLHHTGLAFRAASTSSALRLRTTGTLTGGSVILSGPDAFTTIGTYAASGSWTTLRVVASGTTITVYTDDGAGGWTQIGQALGVTTNQSEVKAGLYSYYPPDTAKRWDNFTVL